MNTYAAAVKAWWDTQGLNVDDLKPLEEALEAWNAAFPAHVAAQNAAQAARQNKDEARQQLEAAARPVTNFIQSYPTTTNTDRATIGITVRDTGATPAPKPTSRPVVVVRDGGRYTHELRLVDESTPTRRARPKGVERAEVFVAFTAINAAAPSDPNAYRYVQSVSDGSTVLFFGQPPSGMTGNCVARSVTRRGASGPWSDTSSATIAA